MSGRKSFKTLVAKLEATPEGRTALDEERCIMRDMVTLTDLRRARGVTQEELARAWEVSQENVSRVEREKDVYLSTLRSYIEALGGRLELTAVFHDQVIRLGGPDSGSLGPTDTGHCRSARYARVPTPRDAGQP